jgi:hypothetical protein
MRGVHVQRTMALVLLVSTFTIGLLIYGNGVHIQQPRGLIHIHNCVDNCLEVYVMEDHQEKEHLIETHLKDHHLIHMLDFMDGKHLIQGYSQYEKSCLLKPHYLAAKTRKTIHIQLLCNYPLGITTSV